MVDCRGGKTGGRDRGIMHRALGLKGGLRDTCEDPEAGERGQRADDEPADPPSGYHSDDAGQRQEAEAGDRRCDRSGGRTDPRLSRGIDDECMHPRASRGEQDQSRPEGAGCQDGGVLPAGACLATPEQRASLRLPLAAAVAEQRIVASMLVQRSGSLIDVTGQRAGRMVSAAAMARSTAAALFRHSASSAAGSESATMPAPAWTYAMPSRRSAVLMAIAVSRSPEKPM